MRIHHVVETLGRGGLERVVVDLALAQHQAGHDVRVTCLFDCGLLARELEATGIPVQACDKQRGRTMAALSRLRRQLRVATPSVLHTHNAAAHYHAMAAAIGLPLKRVVNTRHGMGMADPGGRREWFYRRALGRTDAVVAVCEAARRGFQAQGVRPRGELLVVPNGIRVGSFATASAARRQALAEALGVPGGTRIVGTVGRLTPVKDQAMLLQAFAGTVREVSDVVLAIVGDGPLRADLEALAASLGIGERVRFLGDRSDVADLLAGFDVFALSSLSEGYSIALLEACAAGVPIVATDAGGNGEIVRDGKNGRLVPVRDAGAFSAALVELLRDQRASDAMGRHGRAWAEAEASLKVMVARYGRLYGAAA